MSPPRDVKIKEQQYQSLTFIWKPPDCYHQNAPQDGTKFQYKLWPVKSSTGAKTQWVNTSAPPLIMPGLDKQTLYGFIIRVVNRQGSGKAAEVIFAETDETGSIKCC